MRPISVVAVVCLLSSLVLLCAATAPASVAGTANPNPGVIPLNAKVAGLTYADWGARWWQWAVSYPSDESALSDTTGERAWTGQSGPVFFLCGIAGVPGENSVERTITIPRNTTLFLPVINFVDSRLPCCDEVYGECPMTPEENRDFFLWQLDGMIATVTELHASIDGQQLTDLASYRATTTEFFPVNFAADNPFWCPEGRSEVNLQSGYYLMLSPLKKGQHTLNFGGAAQIPGTGESWSLDVTYNITVD
ncbi:MAG: hypothetical protein ACE149_19035 [Armatimonadota bacterium]